MSGDYQLVTYAFIGFKRRGVADSFVDRDANREGNTLDNDLSVLTLVLKDISSSCFNQFITIFADINDLSTWS
jgi:dimeric dUTPase (all-alpha-NTP-PPase superfamily)